MSDDEMTHNLVVRMTKRDLAELHAVAKAEREPISIVVRRWVRESYRARFGEVVPPVPKLKRQKA
jgi:hypothetical protein